MNDINECKTKEILEYLDLFGTKIGFYAEGKPNFYTALGGILSIVSILISVASFLFYNLDNLKRVSPITSSTPIPSQGYRKIKFNEEKIWIPIKISDYYFNFVNHEGLIYPDIRYYYAERNNLNEPFEKKYKKLNYKLCNETTMANKPDIYSIKASLNQLYCIDSDDIEIGGFWDSTFIGYIKIDMYLCKNGENYNESNLNCTTYDKIKKKIGKENSLMFEIYYPTIQFQPLNYSNPIIILYRHHFYQISKYSNKIARLFLQEYVLDDDQGWFSNNVVNSSYWGLSSLNGDDYKTPETKDLINEGSTSRFYSLNIYLEPGIILYKRSYKKILTIIVEGLPIMYIIFVIFENIAKLFKSTEENKIMIELLFENLKEKPNNFDKHLYTIKKNNNEEIDYSKSNLPVIQVIKDASNENIINNLAKDIPSKNKNCINDKEEKQVINNLNSPNSKKKQNEGIVPKLFIRERNLMNSPNRNIVIFHRNNLPISSRYVAKKLFPNRFYFFSSFIKNSTIKKNNCFFSNKFAKVYSFMTQIIDISAYLVLKREFNILKTKFLDDKRRSFLEKNNKINVGDHNFIKDINLCLSSKNFDIFSKRSNFKK